MGDDDEAPKPKAEAAAAGARPPSVYELARDMTIISSVGHFYGKMRMIARRDLEEGGREAAAGADDEEGVESADVPSKTEAGGGDGDAAAKDGGVGAEADHRRGVQGGAAVGAGRTFSAETARSLLALPVTPRVIVDAIDARGADAEYLDNEAYFGQRNWAEVNRDLLLHKPSPPTWEIVEFSDESKKELSYFVTLDRVERRLTVCFRPSMSVKDWMTNVNIAFGPKGNPVTDGVDPGDGSRLIKQPKKIVMHRGFRDYLFNDEGRGVEDVAGDENDDDGDGGAQVNPSFVSDSGKVRKIDRIMKSVVETIPPGYSLHVTGYSLGAALAHIFSLYAASSTDARLPKPVTCVSIGSPKVGTLSFRKAFTAMEQNGKLRCLRVMNELDPIKEGPYKSFDCWSAFVPGSEYRHVGVALWLREHGGHRFYYPRLTKSYLRQLWDDLYEHQLIWKGVCVHGYNKYLCGRGKYGRETPFLLEDHHSYAEYVDRIEANAGGLRERDLDGLYREAMEGAVPTSCCPCCACSAPSGDVDGDLVLHYY